MPRRIRRRRTARRARTVKRTRASVSRQVKGLSAPPRMRPSRWFQSDNSGNFINPMPMFNINPIPPQKPFHLKYTSAYAVYSSGIAGVCGASSTFRLNSTYGPEASGGHQPYLRDTFASLYGYYKVTSVSIKVTTRYAANPINVVICNIRPSNEYADTIVGLSYQQAAEKPGSTYLLNSQGGEGGASCDFGTLSIQDIEGLTRTMFDGDTDGYNAAVGANPSKVPCLEVSCCDLGGNAGNTVYVGVELVFHGIFYGRINQAQS